MTENAPQYVRLTENNEWEGETWHRYLPVDGNEEALERLRDFLDVEDPEEMWFSLDLNERLTVEQVNTLVDYGNDDNCTYMAQHKKLRGRLNLDGRNQHPLGKIEQLTKGRITDFLFDGAPGDPWPEKPISQ